MSGKSYPWVSAYFLAKNRCEGKYARYKKYGIKFFLTQDNIKNIWFRDKAYLLKKPSLDRIDNNMDYIFENCRFIEFSDNCSRPRRKKFGCKSKYKGVVCETRPLSKKWRALIRKQDKMVRSKYFASEIEAAKEYNRMAKKEYGKDAILNEV